MTTLFFRLLDQEDKAAALTRAVDQLAKGRETEAIHVVDPDSFRQVPGSPFAYWASKRIRDLFADFSKCEGQGREIRCGMGTLDDFRFLRVWWEIGARALGRTREQVTKGMRWFPYAKGGEFARFYSPILLVVNFYDNGKEVKDYVAMKVGSASRKVQAEFYYFRPGITWSRRSQLGLSLRALPAGCIIADKGPAMFASEELLPGMLGLMNSGAFRYLASIQMAFGSYEVGVIQRTPVPDIRSDEGQDLSQLASRSLNLKLDFDQVNETSHVFHLPSLLRVPGATLVDRIASWNSRVAETERQLAEHQREIDDIAFRLYGIEGEDRRAIEAANLSQVAESSGEGEAEGTDFEQIGPLMAQSGVGLVAELISSAAGCVFGRWDVRFATSEKPAPTLPDPFDPLPVCSPGMLQGSDGLPLNQTPEGYPLSIDWDGILVDDLDHPDDIIRRVRDVLEVIGKDRAEAIEREACEILGVADLRDYFRKPGAGGFWDDHIKRYSKSRRKAPIYWLLQSSKKNYALWIYYHRLDKDILFKALLNYVEPKVRKEESRLGELRSQKTALEPAAKGAKKIDKDIERQEGLLSELRDFEDKLRRTANLNLVPDLNDGVVLNIAPLRELVPWKEGKAYWDDLMADESELVKELDCRFRIPNSRIIIP